MSAFFRGEYDLFQEIVKGSEEFLKKSMLALSVAGRDDLQDDVKDAVVSIVTSNDFEDAFVATSSLIGFFEDGFGISKKKIEKRN